MKSLKTRLAVFLTLLLLIGIMMIPAVMARPNVASNDFTNIPVLGKTSGGGSFVGDLTITGFRLVNNKIVADGILNGTVMDRNGNTVGEKITNQEITAPVTLQQRTCQVLYLSLGPINLTLLGLNVDISRIVINITATQGGGLLGDLLCALAGGNTPLAQVVNILNQILRIIGGIGGL